jgi:hypothetical protein
MGNSVEGLKGRTDHSRGNVDLAACRKRIFIELMTSDRKLKASREGST